jgi:hypothetical protein
MRGQWRKRNIQYESVDCKDRRGDAAEATVGAAPGCPSDSINTISFSNMMKRE